MSPLLRSVYRQMPVPLQTLIASVRGLYLQSIRYGPETEQIVEAALERESWNPERWRAWREERLAFVLHRAATRVPYYRAYWTERRRKGDCAPWDRLENWPLLEKDTVRNQAHALVADDRDIRRMYRDTTSGSTGKPVSIWLTREVTRQLYGLFEARVRRWHGVSLQDHWAIAGGQLVTPFDRTRPPFWVWNAAGRQLYLSSYHLKPEFIADYAQAMRRYAVKYIYGYTSSLYAMAREIVRSHQPALNLAVAVTNAEPLSEHQREIIARGFGCPVIETYGMCELVAFSSQCPQGGMHQWPEFGVVEVRDGDGAVPPGTTGELVCTGLLNADMPLIRYRVGDLGSAAAEKNCPCGKTLPLAGSIAGRLDDVLYAADGRAVGRLDPMFKGDLPLREAQIVQESLTTVRLRYVPEAGFNGQHRDALARALRERMGEVRVVFESVSEIPRGPNGKFKAVICNLAAPAPVN